MMTAKDLREARKYAAQIVEMHKAGKDHTEYVLNLLAISDVDFAVVSKALAIAGREIHPTPSN